MRRVLRAVGSARGAVLRIAVGAAVGAVVWASLIGGCSAVPSQLSLPSQLSAAAIVGDTEVPRRQVQGQLAAVLAKEGAQTRAELAATHQLDDLSRKIVTLKVRHELLTVAAQQAGLTVDQAQVDRLITEDGGAEAASKGTIFDADAYRQRAGDQLLMVQLGNIALRNSAITVDYTTADTRAAAKARLEELAQAGPKRARQLIDADVRAGKEAVIGKRIVAADDPRFATTPAFGVADGTVVAFQLADTKPWLIMVVKNRTDRGVRPSDNAPKLDQIEPAVLEVIGLQQLAQVGADVGVELNPRYGVWDPVGLQVVANENETDGFVAPLRPAPRV